MTERLQSLIGRSLAEKALGRGISVRAVAENVQSSNLYVMRLERATLQRVAWTSFVPRPHPIVRPQGDRALGQPNSRFHCKHLNTTLQNTELRPFWQRRWTTWQPVNFASKPWP